MSDRIIYGLQAVGQMLRAGSGGIVEVLVQQDLGGKRAARLGADLEQARVPVRKISAEQLDRLTHGAKHQGVAARIESRVPMNDAQARDFLAARDNPLVLICDGIQDPRNFGALLRTANGAGADLVVVARHRNVAVTGVVSKVAAGAAEAQPLAVVSNLARFMESLKAMNFWLIGTAEEGEESLFEADLTGPLGLVVGAEGDGLRRLTRERCDRLVRLPMHGAVASLNVSVAAGVALYEAVRQRRASLAR